MIEVEIDSIRISLMSQYRVIILRERGAQRYLPIWIGPFEADAITIELQGIEVPRPLTHDLLADVIETLGAQVSHVVVNDLRNDTFYARVVLDYQGEAVEIDSRPSDAIALAVRTNAPIFVAEHVMDQAGSVPEEDLSMSDHRLEELFEDENDVELSEEELGAFREFLEGLDLEGLGDD
ncbi:MAG: bifunctional nuclease family protein [Chloroflexi bacterium]|nr:bifunctional nuclease family protein [Chloroflexota bacterium]